MGLELVAIEVAHIISFKMQRTIAFLRISSLLVRSNIGQWLTAACGMSSTRHLTISNCYLMRSGSSDAYQARVTNITCWDCFCILDDSWNTGMFDQETAFWPIPCAYWRPGARIPVTTDQKGSRFEHREPCGWPLWEYLSEGPLIILNITNTTISCQENWE